MQESYESKYTIITGNFDTGTQEQRDIIASAFGVDQVRYRYRVYFYWYNVIHELGHAILHFNQHNELDVIDEELVVNDFAVAFWSYYGEEQKLAALEEIVQDALSRICCPAPAGMDYITYARDHWGKEGFFSFNSYGSFQFSCVRDALQHPKPLLSVLQMMGANDIAPQPKQALLYDISDDELPLNIVRDATLILRRWGVSLPTLPHLLVDDPMRHGISTVGY